MTTALRSDKLVLAVALMFLVCGSCVRAEFYLRPIAQYSILAGSGSDSTGALGGGLSLGAAFGRERRFDIGAEILHTSYNGTYNEPTAYSNQGGWFGNTPIAWTKVPASYHVTNVLAAFRYSYSDQNTPIRPFIGCVLGVTRVGISKTGIQDDGGISFTGGFGGGASFRLGQRTRLDVGYRYVLSSETSALFSSSNFHYNAHVLSVALDQRF